MLLHFSVSFENAPIKYHGETEYPISAYQNYDKYIDSMTAFVKADLTKSFKKWGYTADDMTAVDFYFFRGAEEVVFFEWEKKDVTKPESTIT